MTKPCTPHALPIVFLSKWCHSRGYFISHFPLCYFTIATASSTPVSLCHLTHQDLHLACWEPLPILRKNNKHTHKKMQLCSVEKRFSDIWVSWGAMWPPHPPFFKPCLSLSFVSPPFSSQLVCITFPTRLQFNQDWMVFPLLGFLYKEYFPHLLPPSFPGLYTTFRYWIDFKYLPKGKVL